MSTDSVSPLRQRMIEDINARKLCAGTQRGHICSCKQFAAFLKRSPDTATSEDIRRFQLHLAENGASICNRNRIMTGLPFLFRVTLRRLDLAAETYHIREPQRIPPVMSPDETKRLLAVAHNLKVRVPPSDAAEAMPRKTQPRRPPTSWDIYRAAAKAKLLGSVEATDEREAIEKVPSTLAPALSRAFFFAATATNGVRNFFCEPSNLAPGCRH